MRPSCPATRAVAVRIGRNTSCPNGAAPLHLQHRRRLQRSRCPWPQQQEPPCALRGVGMSAVAIPRHQRTPSVAKNEASSASPTPPCPLSRCRLPPVVARRNLETKRRLATLRGHTEEVTCVTALTADGEQPLWASGAFDATVRLWDARTPAAAVASLEGCRRRVYDSSPAAYVLLTCQWGAEAVSTCVEEGVGWRLRACIIQDHHAPPHRPQPAPDGMGSDSVEGVPWTSKRARRGVQCEG